jgi:ABC-type antimicrobial peptide transport system permease subunit
MDVVVRQEEVLSRFTAVLMGTFGGLSLFFASLGIYGVLSQSVTQRAREIGLRKALGAQPGSTVRLFLSHAMGLVILGVGIGLVAAFGLTRFAANLLYGIEPHDPVTLAATAAILIGVAGLACAMPIRRALRVDPMVTLRQE